MYDRIGNFCPSPKFWQSLGGATPATLEGGANKENSAGSEGLFFFKEVFVKEITQNCQSSCMYLSE